MRRNIHSIDRYQKIIALRDEGKSFQFIADELGVSRQRIQQIHKRALQRIAMPATMVTHQTCHSHAA